MEEDDITFEDIKSPYREKEEARQAKEAFRQVKFIPGIYDSLSTELKAKCNPANFMNPYNFEKVKIANDIYSSIDPCESDLKKLKELRTRAELELGIIFSTEKLYRDLTALLNPANFIGDREKLDLANELYHQVVIHAYDLRTLEYIEEIALSDERFTKKADTTEKEDNNGVITFILPIGLIILITSLIILIQQIN